MVLSSGPESKPTGSAPPDAAVKPSCQRVERSPGLPPMDGRSAGEAPHLNRDHRPAHTHSQHAFGNAMRTRAAMQASGIRGAS